MRPGFLVFLDLERINKCKQQTDMQNSVFGTLYFLVKKIQVFRNRKTWIKNQIMLFFHAIAYYLLAIAACAAASLAIGTRNGEHET